MSNWLRNNSWICKQGKANLAFQARIDTGLMEHKVTPLEIDGKVGMTCEKPVTQASITLKGLMALVFAKVVP